MKYSYRLSLFSGKEFPSNRKWVVNVGNFLDEEISLTLIGNILTVSSLILTTLMKKCM